jgi:hypothetical protein
LDAIRGAMAEILGAGDDFLECCQQGTLTLAATPLALDTMRLFGRNGTVRYDEKEAARMCRRDNGDKHVCRVRIMAHKLECPWCRADNRSG